jgi:N-acylneuraminate cytidylyltransferase
MISAIIPARGGSKTIPNKNIVMINGKPLIYYVIEACLGSSKIDNIIVSTDSDEIADVVLGGFSAVIISERPRRLATNTSLSEDTIYQVLSSDFSKPDYVVFAQATSPLTKSDDLDNLIGELEKGNDSAAFYVNDYGFFFGEDDMLAPRIPRQLRVPRRREAGNAWAFETKGFMEHKSRLFGKVGLCEIEYPRNLDIDFYADLKVISYLVKEQEGGLC